VDVVKLGDSTIADFIKFEGDSRVSFCNASKSGLKA
jgi:hypothetical protein